MIVSAPGWTAENLQRYTDAAIGAPYDPHVRGRGCPPPPAGRVLHYGRIVDDALSVDERWESNLRGRRVVIEDTPRTLPDVPAERRPDPDPLGGVNA